MNPTQEQIKKFWEWCGIKQDSDRTWRDANGLGVLISTIMPPLDLNNLFKYAVPKLKRWRIANYPEGAMSEFGLIRVWVTTGDWDGMVEDNDPALALFWAIWEIIENEQKQS